MSTKIYTGFILDPGTDIFIVAKKTREHFLPILHKRIHAEFMRSVVNHYDQAYFPETAVGFRRGNKLPKKHEITVQDILKASRKELENHVESIDDFQVRVGFAPDPETGRMLGYFAGRDELFDEFLTFDGVSDYHYQNSSEGPDDISEEDWNTRRQVWDRVLPVGVFSTEMLVATVANPWEINPKMTFVERARSLGVELPSLKARVRSVAVNLAYSENVTKEGFDPSEGMSLYFDTINDKKLIKKWSKNVTDRINKDLSYDLLEDRTKVIGEGL